MKRLRRSILLGAILLAWSTLTFPVLGQDNASADRPLSGHRQEVKEPGDSIATLSKIFVRSFRFTGNRAVPTERLKGIAAPYENREISFEELESLRHALTLHYVNLGYINSGVIIPDQQVTDGVVTFRVIEGSLTGISVEGNRYFRTGYLIDRITRAAGPPVNALQLQEMLQILNQDPRIRQLNAELKPGATPGESVMNVKVSENLPFRVALGTSNNLHPSIGDVRGDLILSHRNLLGLGDILEGSYGKSEGLDEYRASYSIPVTSSDTTLTVHFRKGDTTVVQEEFRGLDIKSKTNTFGFTISRPFFRTPYRELWLSLGGELRRSDMYLLGEGFSFSEGADEGTTKVTVIRFSQDWIWRSNEQVLALRSVFSQGVYAFNATHTDAPGPDGRFLSWLGQVKWVRRLAGGGLQLLFRADMQFTRDPLLPLEKFSLGGMNSVRGYPENQLVRDNGAAGGLELRIPVWSSAGGANTVHLVPFTDIGWAWNSKRDTPQPKSISSAGIGVLWNMADRANLQFFWGLPFRKLDRTSTALQEQGIHFQFVCGLL